MLLRTYVNQLSRAIVLIALVVTQSIAAQTPRLDQPLSTVVAVDSNLRMGTLDSGLRYYIRKNNRPEKQAVIQLCVNAGSINEHDHEQGLAHYLEHTVFKGSPNFKDEKEFNNYFSSRGIAFAADTNAYTGFDRTGYFFVIPTTDQELFAKTFAALGDFASRAYLRDEAIETERPIILDEQQMRNSVNERGSKLLLKALMLDTSYPNRFPGGTNEIIANVPAQTIRNFYTTWYTPQNLAVVAVGDFDPDHVLTLIKEQFGSQPATNKAASTAHIKTKPSPKYGESIFFVDPENRTSSLSIFFYLGTFHVDTVSDLRTMLTASLATAILSQRMETHYYQQNAHTQGMGCSAIPNFLKDNAFSVAYSSFKEGKSHEATAELIDLTKQFATHGIHESELALQKRSMRSRNEQAIANANTLSHHFFKGGYEEHFIQANYLSLASVTAKATLENSLIEEITTQEVNAKATALFDFEKAIYFFAFDPNTYEALGGNAAQDTLRTICKEQAATKTAPYKVPADVKTLELSTQQATGEVITDIPSIDAKKIVLANGMTVYYKWANFTENCINISGFAAGGIDSFQENPITCKLAASAVSDMGFGGIKPFQWSTVLSDKPGLSVSTSIGAHGRGFSAGCRKDDLNFCITLLMTQMLQPNADPDLFSIFVQNTKNSIRDKQNSPQALFSERNSEIVCGHPTLFKPLTEAKLDSLKLDDVIRFYNLAFNNISEFTLAVCGNITLEELVPLLNKTVALAPQNTTRAWLAQPIELSFPVEASRVEFEKKSQQQTWAYVTFPFCIETTLEQERLLDIYETALNDRLREVLRLDNSKSYAAGASTIKYNGLFMNKKDSSGRVIAYFTCDKEQVTQSTDLLIAAMHNIQTNGFTADEIQRAKAIAQNHLIQSFKSNGAWNNYMIDCHVRTNEIFDSVGTLNTLIEETTGDRINAFAQNLINPDHYFAHSLVAGK